MGGILQVDSIKNNNTSNLITQTNTTTITIGASGQTITIPSGATLTNNGTATGFGLTTQSVQTTGFTAVKGNLYPCNTTSSAFTVTLPASASVGDQISIVDYAGTFATNNLTLNPNGLKIQSQTSNAIVKTNNEALTLTYIDSTSGWLVSSAANEGTSAITIPYTISYLIVAGGGGGGDANQGGGGGGAGGLLSSTTSFTPGTIYTVTIGAGGSGGVWNGSHPTAGSDSTITGLSSAIGGGLGSDNIVNATSGGSGGGGGNNGNAAGSGTSGQGNSGGIGNYAQGGGGGGSGAVGGNAIGGNPGTPGAGGVGSTNSLITTTQATTYSIGQVVSSSVYFSGGGGGGNYPGFGPGSSGGSGGGGTGGAGAGTAGTANTGGGGGGSGGTVGGKNGGSGVVILSVPTVNYSGTTTGSPSITTNGSNTIIIFKSTGSYTG